MPLFSKGSAAVRLSKLDHEAFQTTATIVGVIVEFVPFVETWFNLPFNYTNSTVINSGYSAAVPMDYVLELID